MALTESNEVMITSGVNSHGEPRDQSNRALWRALPEIPHRDLVFWYAVEPVPWRRLRKKIRLPIHPRHPDYQMVRDIKQVYQFHKNWYTGHYIIVGKLHSGHVFYFYGHGDSEKDDGLWVWQWYKKFMFQAKTLDKLLAHMGPRRTKYLLYHNSIEPEFSEVKVNIVQADPPSPSSPRGQIRTLWQLIHPRIPKIRPVILGDPLIGIRQLFCL